MLNNNISFKVKTIMTDYDYIVIGGGLGGYPAAIELSRKGYNTAIIEARGFGGECTNYGCIPSKAFIHMARTVFEAKKLPGIRAELSSYTEFAEWRKNIIERLKDGIEYLLKGYGVEIIKGKASFLGQERKIRIKITDGGESKEITAKKVLIATGTEPAFPPGIKPDYERIHDNRSILGLKEIPDTLIIIGGGAIGIEYATAMAMLGADVTVVEMLPQILPGVDTDVVRLLTRSLKKMGIKIYTNSPVKKIERKNEKVFVEIPQQKTLEASHVLVATGRKANTENLNLKSVGVKTDNRGYILVEKTMQTSNPDIYAAGDVTGPPLLAHKAYIQSLIAAKNMTGETIYYDQLIPNVIFSTPEIAMVGLTEEEARKKNVEYKVAKFRYTALSRALIESGGEGYIKLLYDPKDKTILGVQMIGPNSDNIISEITLAMEMHATLEDIALTVHPHPTMSEAFKEVAEVALERPIHVLIKKTSHIT